MARWISALSLKVSSFTALLAIVSFLLGGLNPSWTVVIALFCLTSTAIQQNWWRDREHDARKGRTLATESQQAFLALLLFAWAGSGVLVILALKENTLTGGMLAVIVCLALVYSEVRRIPMLPITLVSFISASPVLLPIVLGRPSVDLWLLFGASVFVIFAREITKDIEDMPIDPGYKWTLPLWVGERLAKVLAAVASLVGLLLITSVSLWNLPGAIIALYGVIMLLRGAKTTISRAYIDCGVALVLLALLVVQVFGLSL